MNKLWLILEREYITRVRKKSFIIGTLLAPLGLLIYFLVIIGLTKYSGSEELKIAVLDEGQMLRNLPDERNIRFISAGTKSLDELLHAAREKQFDAVLRVPSLANLMSPRHTVYFFSEKKLAPEISQKIERRVASRIREYKIEKLNINKKSLEGLEIDVYIDPESLDGSENNRSRLSAGVGLAMGLVMTFIMFFMITMYGNLIMRSVMEEKSNRIVEVMMSSVKPFELMLGKILGAGAVGLTQVMAWVILSLGITLFVPYLVEVDTGSIDHVARNGAQIDPEEAISMLEKIWEEIARQNWWLLTVAFIVYFLGGFFIYSALFAAIGSAMSDDLGEGQALTLPIMIPLILAFYIVAMAGIRNPDSGLMIFSSIFPLFSPIAMPFRLAFDPPWWQLVLSLLLLVAATVFFVWLAGRIYRVGILLYGKKVTFKEISKWLFHKY